MLTALGMSISMTRKYRAVDGAAPDAARPADYYDYKRSLDLTSGDASKECTE